MYRNYFKRPLDFTLSLIAIIALLPVFIVVSVLIKLTSRGNIFYFQERVGQNKKLFKIYKFRSMYLNSDKHQKVNAEVYYDDIRVTPIGKFIRRTKIDELPQLLNVLKGDLSIIGPRPSLADYLPLYEEWENERFFVRPGLSGLAQIRGNIYLTRIQKSYFDLEYIRNITFFNDINIILVTLGVIILGEEKFLPKDIKPEDVIHELQNSFSGSSRIDEKSFL